MLRNEADHLMILLMLMVDSGIPRAYLFGRTSPGSTKN